MNAIQKTYEKQGESLSSARVFLLALGAGLAAASIYYSQPLLGVLGADLQTSSGAVGWVPTLTQLGYALGILLLAPLGDRYDRRRVIVVKAGLLGAALLLSSLSPSLGVLLVASLALGLVATLAQDIVPAAATLAPETQRGRVVGTVMTGLLLGILLSRVVSGFVAELFGWRAVFAAAAIAVLLLGLALWRALPRFAPTSRLPYGQLIASLLPLWRQYPELRRAALAQGLLSVAFSAFWSTLAVMLHGAPYHLGTSAAGAFGLAGAAGALAAPLAGRFADRHGPARVSLVGAALTALSFAAMFLLPALSPQNALWLIGASTLGFDMGIQISLIAHQTIVYGLDPAARSRLNAVLLGCTFVGMSMGAALGNALLAQTGWTGVTALAVLAALGALALRLRAPSRPSRA
jgi:predicted MFS family arabinose efflux permease